MSNTFAGGVDQYLTDARSGGLTLWVAGWSALAVRA
jgi:hypothetical protein